MSSLLHLLGSSLPSLLLILLLGLSGSQGQEELQVLQPKDPLSVAEGETVTLKCTVPGTLPAGPVVWFKGKGPQRQEIFNFKGGTYPRIKKASPLSNTDYSINISHITPEDSGTYYCVKFIKGNPDTELTSGGGTMLSVTAKPSVPVVSGPQERINTENMRNFSCNSRGFSPKTITLKWFKNGNEIHAHWTKIFPEGDSVSYNISSTVLVKLEGNDVNSKIICEVNHVTLQFPLRGSKALSEVIRVKPAVNISSQLFANYSTITCHVMKFYPKNVSVFWLENGKEIVKVNTSKLTENKDGTYNLNTPLLVNVYAQKETRKMTCLVQHDSQPPISASKTIKSPSFSGTIDKKESEKEVSGHIFVIFLLGLKVLLLFGIAWLYALKKQKIKEAALFVPHSSAPAQLHPAFIQSADLGLETQETKRSPPHTLP